MWLTTTTGFYSIVQYPDTDYLTVRARVRKDLKDLKAKYMPELSKIIFHDNFDYPYRAMITHELFALGVARIAMDIDYSNFKNTVFEQQGARRAGIYATVWSNLIKLETDPNRINRYYERQLRMFDDMRYNNQEVEPSST